MVIDFFPVGQTGAGSGPWLNTDMFTSLVPVVRGLEAGGSVKIEVLSSTAQPTAGTSGAVIATITPDANGNGIPSGDEAQLLVQARVRWMRATKLVGGVPTLTHCEAGAQRGE